MRFCHTVLESMAVEEAPLVLTSEDLEERLSPLYDRLRLPRGRLELMTGIKSRRFWNEGTRPSDASSAAGRKALRQSSVPVDHIDILVHAGVCRDRLEPSTASYVHRNLGLPRHTQIFDVSNACLGFLNAMTMAGGMIDAGQARAALIVSGENGGPLVERTVRILLDRPWTRREIKPFFANLTIGSGAVAAVLCHQSLASPAKAHALLGGVAEAATEFNHLCEGDATGEGLEMLTDSEELLLAGIGVARQTWDRFKKETGWDESTPAHFICHQVGSAHRLKLYEALGIDLAKDYSTFPDFGNMGSVSLPFTLAKAAENGRLRPGDPIALLGIGSGLSCLMLALRW